jgi:O-antigen ligase
LIGLYFNQEKTFDVFNTFLAFLSIGTVCLLALCDQIKVENILKYFFWASLIILTLVFITILSFKLVEIKNYDSYTLFSPRDSNIVTLNNPRISGLSRTLAILNLFLILYFFSLKQYYFKKILLFFSLSISLLLLLMESRGTLLSYFVTLTFITLFLVKKNTIFKIKYFLILIVFPIVLSISIFNNYTNKETPTKNDKIFNSRIVAQHTSSRLKIWTYTLKNYDYKKIFGYGPQGDRFFLNQSKYFEKGYNNSSNILIYTLLSGGVMSIFFWILVFFEIFKTFIKNRNSFLLNINNYYLNFSISCIIFFSVRSIVENSFGLFSIDFLIMNLSIVYMLNSFKIQK